MLLAVQAGADKVPALGNSVQASKASAKTDDRDLKAAGSSPAALAAKMAAPAPDPAPVAAPVPDPAPAPVPDPAPAPVVHKVITFPPAAARPVPTAAPMFTTRPAEVFVLGAGPPGGGGGSTLSPVQKYVGPIIGGVVGAAAIGGVIALSVMNKKTTTFPAPVQDAPKTAAPFEKQATELTAPVAAGATEVPVAEISLIVVGDDIVFDQGSPQEEVDVVAGLDVGRRLIEYGEGDMAPGKPGMKGSLVLQTPLKFNHAAGATLATVPKSQGPPPPSMKAKSAVVNTGNTTATGDAEFSSGLSQSTVLTIAGALLACLILAFCAAVLSKRCGGKKKKTKKKAAPDYMPEDQQPLNMDTQIDVPESTVDIPGMESQYMAVGLQPSYAGQPTSMYAPASAPASVYAPASMYANAQPSYAGIGSVPTMMAIPMQTMPPPPPAPIAPMWQPGASQFMPASPLANTYLPTANAMPTTMFTGQLPPTIY